MDAHRDHEPVSILPRWLQNVFLQVSGLQSDDKTLMQVKQSFECCSARIGSWKGLGRVARASKHWLLTIC
jgi:hypothetical protein